MHSMYLIGLNRARRPARAALIGIIVGTAAGGSVLFASLASGASTGRAHAAASVMTKSSLIEKSELQLRDRRLTPKDQLADGLLKSASAESRAAARHLVALRNLGHATTALSAGLVPREQRLVWRG